MRSPMLLVVILFVAILSSIVYFGKMNDQNSHTTGDTTPTLVTRPVVSLSHTTEPTVPQPKCSVKTGVPTGYLNLRAGAGTEYPVLIVLAENDELDYLGQDNDGWKFVQFEDKQGWVFDQYVKNCN